MASEEEIDLVKSSLSKVRYINDKNGNRVIHPDSEQVINTLRENANVLKEYFTKFAVQSSSIMRPGTFIYAVQEIDGGKELIFDNIDFLLRKHAHNRNDLVRALSEIDGISEILLNELKNRFNLFVYGDENIEDKYVNNSEYDNYSTRKMSYDENYRAIRFMATILKSPSAHDIISQNADLFFTPKNNSAMPVITKLLQEKNEYHDIIKDNIVQIRKAFLEEDLPAFYQSLKDVLPEEYERNKFVIEKLYEPSMKYLKDNEDKLTGDSGSIILSKILSTCGRIIAQDRSKDIETLLEFASQGQELELCHDGGTAIVAKVNEKVFKFSANRVFPENFETKYHPKILRPIVRKKDVSANPNKPLFVEIQDEVDVNIEVSDEELLEVYKELRKDGIRWCDARKANLGRLKKDNYGYPGGANMPSNAENLGFLEDETHFEVLKAGEIVIIDDDGFCDAKDRSVFFTPQTPEFIVEYEEKCRKKENDEKAKAPEEY